SKSDSKSTTPGSPSPLRLVLALLLLLSYALLVSLSDIGFIGLYACDIPGSSTPDFPASVKSDADALRVVSSNLVNGTDPASVYSRRCDAAELHIFSANVSERTCTAWHNSTYADGVGFRELNTTDSDVLMPRQLTRYVYARSDEFDLNVYFRQFSLE
ncbi:hypothetical protein H0H81_008764, partial [Sphagnurus paluster]